MAKKTIVRTRYPLEDNVKRALFIRPGAGAPGTPNEFEIPYATREETDLGALTDKALNPDVGAYAYDRFRYVGRHAAGKATRTVKIIGGATVEVDCQRSNTFSILANSSFLLSVIRPLPGQVIKLRFKQDDVGGRQATWPDNFRWVYGEEPQLTLTPNAVDVAYMGYDEDDDVWEGNLLPDCR